MKKLVAITIMVMLISSLKGQPQTLRSIQKYRANPKSIDLAKQIISVKKGYSEGKPTLDSCVYEDFDTSTGKWIKGYKQVFKYTTGGIPSLSFSYYWDTEFNDWIPLDKIEVEFNPAGNLILDFYYVYSNGQYNPYEKIENVYNVTGLISGNITSSYMSGTLYKQDQNLYEYDGNGYIKSILRYWRNAIDQPWVYVSKYEFTVDIMGRIIQEMSTDYDLNNDGKIDFMDWINRTYTYSTDGNMISSMVNVWDNDLKKWYADTKIEYTYNTKGQKLTERGYLFNVTSNEFKLTIEDEWIYDSKGNNTTYIFRELDVMSGKWSMEKTELIFDLFTLAEDYSLPYAFEFNCVNKPIGIRYYDEFTDPDWNLFSSGTYYYSNSIINKVNPLIQSKVTCRQQLRNFTFSWDNTDEFLTFEIFNLSGQKVYSSLIMNNQTTTLENLPDGLYLYRLSNDKMIFAGKFLLK